MLKDTNNIHFARQRGYYEDSKFKSRLCFINKIREYASRALRGTPNSSPLFKPQVCNWDLKEDSTKERAIPYHF